MILTNVKKITGMSRRCTLLDQGQTIGQSAAEDEVYNGEQCQGDHPHFLKFVECVLKAFFPIHYMHYHAVFV